MMITYALLLITLNNNAHL